jgi:MFS family permease
VQYAMLAGPLLSMLDSSVVNVAAEPVARSLHASLAAVQWTVSGYLLALGTGLAGTAYLARRFGTLAVYRTGLVAFTAASALCAVAPGIGALIGFRAVQGLVAAPLVPLAMSMLLGKSGKVPFGTAAARAARRLPGGDSGHRSEKSEFDLFGLVLLAAGLLLLLLGTSEGGTDGWGSAGCLGPLVTGAALLAAYVLWASRRARPVLDLSLARRPVAALSMGLCALASVVTWAAVFLLPVFVQSVQGRSALAAGVAMAPQGLVTGLSTVLGSRVLTRFTVRSTVCCGFFVLGVASLLVEVVGAATPLWVISLILAARSASIGLVISPLLAALTGPLPPERMGDASTLFNVVNRVAGSFGIGLLASLYAVLARSAGGPVYALHVSGIVIACVAALGAAAALALPRLDNSYAWRCSAAGRCGRGSSPRRPACRHPP